MAFGNVLRSFAAPANSTRGVASDGHSLFVADSTTALVYRINPANGSVLQTLAPTGVGVNSMAYDKVSRRLLVGGGSTVGVVNPANGTTLAVFWSSAATIIGVATDGRTVWLSYFGTDFVDELPRYPGKQLAEADALSRLVPPATSPTGLEFGRLRDKRVLWLTSITTDLLYEIDLKDFSVLRSASTPGTEPRDIAFDGHSIWLTDDSSNLIYELSLS